MASILLGVAMSVKRYETNQTVTAANTDGGHVLIEIVNGHNVHLTPAMARLFAEQLRAVAKRAEETPPPPPKPQKAAQ